MGLGTARDGQALHGEVDNGWATPGEEGKDLPGGPSVRGGKLGQVSGENERESRRERIK